MNWEKVKLGEISFCIQPGPFGSQLHNSDYADEGTPIIMPKDMVDGHIRHTGLIRVPEEHVARLQRHQVRAGNLMVARKGDVRKCVYITESENGWLTGSDCLKVALNENVCFPKYIYYQLRSPYIGRWLEQISIGATMPSINTGLLSGIEIYLPSLETQRRIADILSAYDDLIENNGKQIKLLEEAAQRLYIEWFVYLRFPGYEHTKIIDGLPEGWKKSTVLNASSVLRRGISPRYNDLANYMVINQKCIRQTVVSFEEARNQEKPYSPEMNLQDSDTVICSTGAGTLGRVGQIFGNHPNTTFDSHVTLVRAMPDIGPQYLFWFLKSKQAFLMGMGKGSTNQLELSRSTIQDLTILVPTEEVVQKFEIQAQAIHDKISVANNEITRLINARERLLPKLMSGEVEV